MTAATLAILSSTAMAADESTKPEAGFTQRGTFSMFNIKGAGLLHEVDPKNCIAYAQGKAPSIKIIEYYSNDGEIATNLKESTDNKQTELFASLMCDYAILAGADTSQKTNGDVNVEYLLNRVNYNTMTVDGNYQVLDQTLPEDRHLFTAIYGHNDLYKMHLPVSACTRPKWDAKVKMGFYTSKNKLIGNKQYSQTEVKRNPLYLEMVNHFCENTLRSYEYIKTLDFNSPQDKAFIDELNERIN